MKVWVGIYSTGTTEYALLFWAIQNLSIDRTVTEAELLPPRCVRLQELEATTEPFGFVDAPVWRLELAVFAPEFPADLRNAFLRGDRIGVAIAAGRGLNPNNPWTSSTLALLFVGMVDDAGEIDIEGEVATLNAVDLAHYVASLPIAGTLDSLSETTDEGNLLGRFSARWAGQEFEGREAYHEGDLVVRDRYGVGFLHLTELFGTLIQLEPLVRTLGEWMRNRALLLMPSIATLELGWGRAVSGKALGDVWAGIGESGGQPARWMLPTTWQHVGTAYVPLLWRPRQGSEWSGWVRSVFRESVRDWMRRVGETLLQLYNAWIDAAIASRFTVSGLAIPSLTGTFQLGATRVAWVDNRSVHLVRLPVVWSKERGRYGRMLPRRCVVSGLPWGDEEYLGFARRGLDWGATLALSTTRKAPERLHFVGGLAVIRDQPFETGSDALPLLAQLGGWDQLWQLQSVRCRAYIDDTVTLLTEDQGAGGDGITRDYRLFDVNGAGWDFTERLSGWLARQERARGLARFLTRGVFRALQWERALTQVAHLRTERILGKHYEVLGRTVATDTGTVLGVAVAYTTDMGTVAGLEVLNGFDLSHYAL